MLSERDTEIIKARLIAIADHELSIEKQRQYLARLEEFEPYATFVRLDRNNNGFLTAKDILWFLIDNDLAEATIEDCAYIVKFFDSDEDGVLNYTDYMQLVITCDDTYLRAAVTQREPYGVNVDEFLSPILERELSILFEKEIAYHRELNSFSEFDYIEGFKELDEERIGFIDSSSVDSFLRRNGFAPTDEELTAIIRRIDVSADARISYPEFEEAMKPVIITPKDSKGGISSRDYDEKDKYKGTYKNRDYKFEPKLANPSKVKLENLRSGYYELSHSASKYRGRREEGDMWEKWSPCKINFDKKSPEKKYYHKYEPEEYRKAKEYDYSSPVKFKPSVEEMPISRDYYERKK